QNADKRIDIIAETCLNNVIAVHRPYVSKPVHADDKTCKTDADEFLFVTYDHRQLSYKRDPLAYTCYDNEHEYERPNNSMGENFSSRDVFNKLPIDWEESP